MLQQVRKVPTNSTKSKSTLVTDSMRYVINYMNNNHSDTWTVSELHDMYIEHAGLLSRKQMLATLVEYFGEEIIILHLEGCSSIVGFRAYVGKTLKVVQQSKDPDTEGDVDSLVRRIQGEVNSIALPHDYDLNSFQYDNIVQDTSASLLTFVSRLVSDGETSKVSLTLSQCIQQHISKSTNQTSLGLAVRLHHKFGS